jgi:6-phosphogluconate dehydrogenase
LYSAKLVSYAQGLMLLAQASKEYNWEGMDFSGIARMWRGGCIIRSAFLNDIHKAFTADPNLTSLLLDPFFAQAISKYQGSWRLVLAEAIMLGIPMPAFSSALAFFDGFRSARLPANLLQAQRDYFGAHTFEYEDAPGTFHHINWTGTGGNVTSSTYQA